MQEVVTRLPARTPPRAWVPVVALFVALGLGCGRDEASPTPSKAPAVTHTPAAPAAPLPRLVSLTPSSTEIVAALGATAMLVGVDDYSAYPPEVTRLPKVGSFLAPNLEIIV